MHGRRQGFIRPRPEASLQIDRGSETELRAVAGDGNANREEARKSGLSSYYDNLLLFRAGLITVPKKFKLLLKPEIAKR